MLGSSNVECGEVDSTFRTLDLRLQGIVELARGRQDFDMRWLDLESGSDPIKLTGNASERVCSGIRSLCRRR